MAWRLRKKTGESQQKADLPREGCSGAPSPLLRALRNMDPTEPWEPSTEPQALKAPVRETVQGLHSGLLGSSVGSVRMAEQVHTP